MDTLAWDEIVKAIDAYRSCPQQEQFDSLCSALADRVFYVPVGDFDGNNALVSPLVSVQGGSFIPLYSDKDNVRPTQPSEGVSPVDWQHILSQMAHVEGCVIEPYSVNFAFDRSFIDALVAAGTSPDVDSESQWVPDGVHDEDNQEEHGNEEEHEEQSADVPAVPAVHGWTFGNDSAVEEPEVHDDLPADSSEETSDGDSFDEILSSDSSDEASPSDSPEETSVDTPSPLRVPNTIPAALNEPMQAVADELSVPLWLFERNSDDGEQAYLMVINAPNQWFEEGGAQAVNSVLGRFPDPGVRLDFVVGESELGRYADGIEPHYNPREQGRGQRMHSLHEQTHKLFRRLFKR